MKKRIPLLIRIPIYFIGSLIGMILLAWVFFNVFKFPYFGDFYRNKKDVMDIPGINEGYTPQGIAYSETQDIYFFSGYSKEVSYIYAKGKGIDKTTKFELYKNGKKFNGHVGGVATEKETLYIADGGHIYSIDISSFITNEKKIIEIGEGFKVNNHASFVFTNDNSLFVGEFNDDSHYKTEHEYGNNKAIVAEYNLSDFDFDKSRDVTLTPKRNISIRNKVQGFAMKSDGTIILSTSWGITDSYFYVYDPTKLVETSDTLYGAKMWTLNDHTKKMKAPAMMEDLDIGEDDRVLVYSECACNKYIFGKLFFSTKLYSIKF